MDMIIRDARLVDDEGSWEIGIEDGRIAEVSRRIEADAGEVIDAAGRLVAPTYINGHVHLDKCNLGDVMRPNETNTFQECLEITWEHKRSYTVDDIVERAGRAIEEGILNGTTVFRVFADVDSIGGLRPLEGIIALREKWDGIVKIEAVDFPQEAIIRDAGTFELMEEGMRMGADVVGGLPWHEHLDEDARGHIDICFELAGKYDKDIHMLVDDTDNANSRSLEYLAVKTMREGFQGRVSATDLGGPIMIAQEAGRRAANGLEPLLRFMALISVNLGVINVLPIPVLDGGHLLFFGIEALRGRPLSLRYRELAQRVGVFLLLALMVFVVFNDISRIVGN